MRLYVPEFLPGDIVAFLSDSASNEAVVSTVKYAVFNPDSGYSYYVNGWSKPFRAGDLTFCPTRILSGFEIK